jgi:hypothetical protein
MHPRLSLRENFFKKFNLIFKKTKSEGELDTETKTDVLGRKFSHQIPPGIIGNASLVMIHDQLNALVFCLTFVFFHKKTLRIKNRF